VADIKNETWLKSLCRSYTEANVRTLAGWACGPETPDDLKMKAIGMLMERGWGRPTQDNTHTLQGEVRVILREMLKDEDDDK